MVVINRLNPWLNKQSNRLSGWLAYEILKKFLVIVQPSFLSQRDTITTWIRDEQFEARHGSHKEDTNVYESAAVNLDSCDVFRSIQDPTAPQFPSAAAARRCPPPPSAVIAAAAAALRHPRWMVVIPFLVVMIQTLLAVFKEHWGIIQALLKFCPRQPIWRF